MDPTDDSTDQRTVKTKRTASSSEEEFDTRATKKIKAFLARAVNKCSRISEIDALEIGFAATILKDRDIEVTIPIPRLYKAAINDPVYGPK